jgi:hemerythrin-like domain-containing protein
MTKRPQSPGRRQTLKQAALAAPLALIGARRAAAGPAKKDKDDDEDVSPTEDLMREHGVLRRLLLVYGKSIRSLAAGQELKTEPVAHAAQIIRAFIEDYHERDEEEFIFPRFRKAGKMVDLVDVLVHQHQAGRKLTADVLRLATPASVKAPSGRQELAATMTAFIQMYEPHAAREDTVLFPAFRTLVSEKELDQLQETFEQKEKALPGGDFEKMVSEVARLEQAVGIHDLAQFTPKT